MGTAASPLPDALPTPFRPTWRRSAAAAALGVLVGGLASAAVIGCVVVVTFLAGGGPVEDAIGNALAPLSLFAVVPIAVAVWVDAICRREVFWLVTGMRPSPGTTIAAALLAPAAAVGIGWRGGVVAYVLAVSTVLLRCCATPGETTPRRFLAQVATTRSRGRLAALAAGAALVAIAGSAAFTLGTPALSSPGTTHTAGGVPTARHIALTNHAPVGVTLLGLDGPLAEIIRIDGPGLPLSLERGETRTISIAPAPSCTDGDAEFSSIDVRYRVLGIERISSVDLGGQVRIRC